MKYLSMVRLTLLSWAMFLVGCHTTRQTVSNAFDDLVNETNSSSTLLVDYRSFLSVSGLSSTRNLSSYLIHPAGFSPTHAIGVSPKWSYYLVNDYIIKSEDLPRIRAIGASYREVVAQTQRFANKAVVLNAIQALESDSNSNKEEVCRMLGMLGNCSAPSRQAAISKARLELDELEQHAFDLKQKFQEASDIPNVVIMRWNRESAYSRAARYGETAGLSQDGKTGSSGLAIYADLRVEALYVGEDFIDVLRQYRDPGKKWVFTRSSISTYQVKARYIEYVSDQSSELGSRLDIEISPNQLKSLKNLFGADWDATKLAVQLASNVVSDIGNRGRLEKPIVHHEPLCFFPPRVHQLYLKKMATQNQEYSSIYGVEAQIGFLASLFLSSPETDLTRITDSPKIDEGERKKLLGQYIQQCGDDGSVSWDTFAPPFDSYFHSEK